MFRHDAGPQALIQFKTAKEAEEVKQMLQARVFHIDNKIITFEVQFSKFKDLRVNQNNKLSWDFTQAVGLLRSAHLQPLPPSSPSEPASYLHYDYELPALSSSFRGRSAPRSLPQSRGEPWSPADLPLPDAHAFFSPLGSKAARPCLRAASHGLGESASWFPAGGANPRCYSSDGRYAFASSFARPAFEAQQRAISQDGRTSSPPLVFALSDAAPCRHPSYPSVYPYPDDVEVGRPGRRGDEE